MVAGWEARDVVYWLKATPGLEKLAIPLRHMTGKQLLKANRDGLLDLRVKPRHVDKLLEERTKLVGKPRERKVADSMAAASGGAKVTGGAQPYGGYGFQMGDPIHWQAGMQPQAFPYAPSGQFDPLTMQWGQAAPPLPRTRKKQFAIKEHRTGRVIVQDLETGEVLHDIAPEVVRVTGIPTDISIGKKKSVAEPPGTPSSSVNPDLKKKRRRSRACSDSRDGRPVPDPDDARAAAPPASGSSTDLADYRHKKKSDKERRRPRTLKVHHHHYHHYDPSGPPATGKAASGTLGAGSAAAPQAVLTPDLMHQVASQRDEWSMTWAQYGGSVPPQGPAHLGWVEALAPADGGGAVGGVATPNPSRHDESFDVSAPGAMISVPVQPPAPSSFTPGSRPAVGGDAPPDVGEGPPAAVQPSASPTGGGIFGGGVGPVRLSATSLPADNAGSDNPTDASIVQNGTSDPSAPIEELMKEGIEDGEYFLNSTHIYVKFKGNVLKRELMMRETQDGSTVVGLKGCSDDFPDYRKMIEYYQDTEFLDVARSAGREPILPIVLGKICSDPV